MTLRLLWESGIIIITNIFILHVSITFFSKCVSSPIYIYMVVLSYLDHERTIIFANYSDDAGSPLLWTTMTLFLLLNVHGGLNFCSVSIFSDN